MSGYSRATNTPYVAARDFSQAALPLIGRHITVDHVPRIQQCVQLLTANSAFQHVRSLDLGVTSKTPSPEVYLDEQLTILEIFSPRRSLTRLWQVPFSSIGSDNNEKLRDIVAALGSTVDDLSLRECHFSSRNDIISFICAFPHCDSLYVRDCAVDSK